MAGLLDFLETPEGQGLLSATFGGLAGARRGQPLNSLGRAGLAGLSGYGGALDRKSEQDQLAKRNELFELQLKQMRQAQTDADLARANETRFRASIPSPRQAMLDGAMSDGRGPTVDNAERLAPVDPRNEQLWQAMSLGQIKPVEYINAITKDDAQTILPEGATLVGGRGSGYKVLASGSPKTATLSPVGRLTAERDLLPEGHPSRALYDRAIQKEITPAAGVSVTYGAPVAGVGLDGKPIFFQPGRDGGPPIIVPGVQPPPEKKPAPPVEFTKSVTGLNELGNTLNTYAKTIDDLGSAPLSVGAKRAKLKNSFTAVQMGLKNAMELGALAGPDLDLLNGMLLDPTSAKAILMGDKGLKQQIASTRDYLRNRGRAVYDAHKQPVPAEYADQPPSVDDLVNHYKSPGAR
ncbi:hypothetical protein UFOVP73_62 [uncultured Caudovirales phage]|uniref:Uncharacterized protein n=1 Tax=uncultured Caudovirales phage TaxID=2100421 RepID=A0A6J5KYU1_9CAUD|nr:hypothetical protein UFOVP73_62 [uncultured Caudovirales phage]CAB5194767.1 hypothetical protein UFOVP170_22 [uncultured Caudovirales phage]